MNNDFTPWIEALGKREYTRAKFFKAVFAKLEELGFTLQNQDAIDGGYRLEFQLGDKWVIADRYSSFPVAGETPGIHLYDETNSWEASFTAYAPLLLVMTALDFLNTQDND